MTTMSHTVTDSATMLRRSLRHIVRYPSMTLMLIGMPIMFLLLFVYVFGGTLGAGWAPVPARRVVEPATPTTSRRESS
jgi:ABC-2 type transport system permease protein